VRLTSWLFVVQGVVMALGVLAIACLVFLEPSSSRSEQGLGELLVVILAFIVVPAAALLICLGAVSRRPGLLAPSIAFATHTVVTLGVMVTLSPLVLEVVPAEFALLVGLVRGAAWWRGQTEVHGPPARVR